MPSLTIQNVYKYLRHATQGTARKLSLYRLPLLWDFQYKSGKWNKISVDRRPLVVALAEQYAAGGAIVELAAGEGTLLLTLSPHSYSHYLGIDISREAIGKARTRMTARSLTNCQFRVGDMLGWEGGINISLVIFEECLYYLSLKHQTLLLTRAVRSLKDSGAVLITFHSKTVHRESINNCLSLGFQSEVIEDGEGVYILLFPRIGRR